MYHVLLTDTAKEISVKAFWSFRTADSSTPSYLWSSSKSKDAIFPKEVLKSVQYHGEQLSQGLAWGSQKERWLSFSFTSRSLTLLLSTSVQSLCPCLHLHCKGSWQPFFFFLGWMEKQLERYAVMERAGEAMSVSLSTSLQASFMPLSLAQWLTLSTPLSLLTLLHTEPQQYIDMPLRQLITSSGCGNGVHTRVENAYRCSLSLFFFFFYFFHLYFLSCSDLIQHFW